MRLKTVTVSVCALLAGAAEAQVMDDRQVAAVEAFWAVQEDCQGGIPGTAEMEKACLLLEEARIEMIAAGLCWGQESGPHTYMRSVPCSDPDAYETILGVGIRWGG